MSEKNYFTELYAVNVNDKKEKKNGLDYLSWAAAWAEICKRDPKAEWKVFARSDGAEYFVNGSTARVKTSVTAFGKTLEMSLNVMDHRNQSLIAPECLPQLNPQAAAQFGNAHQKAIMRCLAKNIAMHGLGLYIYEGEDIPEPSELNADQIAELRRLISETDTDERQFLAHFRWQSLAMSDFNAAKNALEQKLAALQAKHRADSRGE